MRALVVFQRYECSFALLDDLSLGSLIFKRPSLTRILGGFTTLLKKGDALIP
jgi:hypothetical protein